MLISSLMIVVSAYALWKILRSFSRTHTTPHASHSGSPSDQQALRAHELAAATKILWSPLHEAAVPIFFCEPFLETSQQRVKQLNTHNRAHVLSPLELNLEAVRKKAVQFGAPIILFRPDTTLKSGHREITLRTNSPSLSIVTGTPLFLSELIGANGNRASVIIMNEKKELPARIQRSGAPIIICEYHTTSTTQGTPRSRDCTRNGVLFAHSPAQLSRLAHQILFQPAYGAALGQALYNQSLGGRF